MLDLAERVRRVAPGDLDWCFFNSSGSEANESAMHLAVLYWELQGKPGQDRLPVARHQLPRLDTGSVVALWIALARAVRAAACRSTRAYPTRTTAEEGAAALEAAIQSRGADHVAAFVVEPMTGSSGAAVDLPDGYLRAVREVCDRHDVLLIADEIVTGFGRTGKWFASEHFGATPDVITFGKGHRRRRDPALGNGGDQSDTRSDGSESPTGFSYGHTFSGYPLGCAVGCEVIDIVEDEGLVQASEQKGARLRGMLEELQGRHPIMHALRGRGLLQGVELRYRGGEPIRASRTGCPTGSPGRPASATS